jgi:hypothetical protein
VLLRRGVAAPLGEPVPSANAPGTEGPQRDTYLQPNAICPVAAAHIPSLACRR